MLSLAAKGIHQSLLRSLSAKYLNLHSSPMATCKTLVRTSLHFIASSLRTTTTTTTSLRLSPRLPSLQGLKLNNKAHSRPFASTNESALFPEEPSGSPDDDEIEETDDTVESLLTHRRDSVAKMMKMERRPVQPVPGRWFPYLDRLRCGASAEEHRLTSGEVVEAMEPYIMEPRMDRFRRVVCGRSYSVCLVIEGLSDFGNVSAAFRSADALGFQSVHVVSCDSSKRYRENRHVSMGAEKWLDIELWDSIEDCFEALKSRGYRIATTHVGNDAVSVYDMDWSCPTAIVVGNESRGVSEEALGLSDLRCIIPMNGMVDSLNVSVAAGIAMHHAVSDRTTRLGSHGDLSPVERQILLAEFCLRHNRNSIRIATGYAKRKAATLLSPKL